MDSPAALLSALGSQIEGQLVALRRDLHQHPELSWEEEWTSDVITEALVECGLRPLRLDPTGVIAEIDGGAPGPVTVLRADIDALPLQDTKTVEYRSRRDGVTHACGHDVHAASVLGAAMLLSRLREAGHSFPGRVLALFQPAEEVVPCGAAKVLADGWLREATRALGLHCDPTIPAGKVGLRVGAVTAAVDDMDITVRSSGGHTARPHLTVDTTFLLGRLLTELPGVVGRRVDPRASLTIGFGSVHAGSAGNVIATEGHLAGTLRTTSLETWRQLPELVGQVAHAMGLEHGAEVEVHYRQGMPPIENDPGCIEALRRSCEMIGPEVVVPTEQSMGGDDFGWYGTRMPVAYARLGVGSGVGGAVLHQSGFDVDESAILVGARLLAGAVV